MSDDHPQDDEVRLALPLEILNQVLLLASFDTKAILSLSLVCRTVHSWLIPVLYHSISFTKSRQLSKFLSGHDIPNDPLESRFSLIQNLYIGHTPHTAGNLLYGSSSWPLTIVSRILWLSTSLKRLTILNLDQNKWRLFEHVIPASLEHLTLGPVHGPFHPQDLTRRPRLKTFTSAATYMRDDEVRDVVCFPSMRVFRRMMPPLTMISFYAVNQVKCVEEARTLESLQIMLTGFSTPQKNDRKILDDFLLEVTKDPRVVVIERREEYVSVVWGEFEECRVNFIVRQII
ncbi:hypothetical protein BDN70DRAFT_883420 [Pholiota conissans]|uniref:F-box domain-containing protein n=1 Tax=Pholiota conissans TaxID=109636 RepID=A0A9P5YTX9_9AGAR|nr:hypothetical protein BDN70DRAFT_883420 [Pholiota conissans]